MADFFGGILDGLRGTGDDKNALFGGGVAANDGSKNFSMGQQEQGDYSSGFRGYADPYEYRPPVDKNYKEQPADFNSIEYQWLRRLQRFSEITSTIAK